MAHTTTRKRVRQPTEVRAPEAVLLELTARGLIDLAREVAKQHHAHLHEIAGRSRERHIARARFDLWWRVYSHHGLSTPTLGRIFGRDHTTIIDGIAAHELRTMPGDAEAAE